MINRQKLKPLYPVLLVTEDDTIEIPSESISPELIGEKAFGLSCLPKLWTLPFIVVSDKLLSHYHCCSESDREAMLKQWAPKIISAALSIGMKEQMPIIVRSSGYSEGLEERGKFYSAEGVLENILQPLVGCLQKLSSDTDLNKHKIFLVIQQYAIPVSAKGHLSNERRCYKEKRDWLGEFEDIKTRRSKAFQINLRNWRKKIIIGHRQNASLSCKLSAHVSEVLKIPATWALEQKQRIHFEWVWDGDAIYLVQSDQEHEVNGIDPTIVHQLKQDISFEFKPKCLKEINHEHAIKYNKIHNVFTYMKLKLPFTKIYVLDNQTIIDNLASGQASADLKQDISEIVKRSLVIRMDIATSDKAMRQLLPRTNEVRDLDSALEWLKRESAKIKGHGIHEEVVFIFHNFMPAVSSAFAYAAPGVRKVQIEALWGLPEGLYYNSHDKYIIDTQTPRGKELRYEDIDKFVVQEKINFKRFFVAPDKDGRWTTHPLKSPYDWIGSIQKKEWVKEIALESRRIAEEEGASLSIMWFIGISPWICSRPIMPWYHELYDPKISSRAPTQRTKTPFDKSVVIRTSEDIAVLQQEAEKPRSSVRRVRIQPREENLLRDKDTLRLIGESAKKIDAVILLEGAILSHAYYQLIKSNAVVEVLHPFGDFDDKQEFNKLVRDKIPLNIEHRGEVVTEAHLSGEFLLRALREKLTEEAFEVLDAIDQNSIVDELADVSEVIDGLLSHLGISRDELKQRQEIKRERAGGFKNGLVLLETRNPLPIKKDVCTDNILFDNKPGAENRESIPLDGRELIEISHRIDKSTDRREHQAATEVILRLLIPMVRESWAASTPETVIDSDSGDVIKAEIIGTRLSSKLRIELSIFSQQKQLKLF